MDKNTVLAIILTTMIITAGMFITNSINEKNAPPVDEILPESVEQVVEETEPIREVESLSRSVPDQDFEKKSITEETNLFSITFSTVGGIATDIDLITEYDDNKPISMILDGNTDVGTFNLAFGGPDAPYITEVFDHKRIQRGKQIIHEFTRQFQNDGRTFTLVKSYRMIPDEYLIELIITLKTPDGRAVPLLDTDQAAYTLTYGPQIGPEFEKLDGRYEVRDFVSWGPDPRSGKIKRKTHKNRNKLVEISDTVTWAGVIGKYFAVIINPGSGGSTITWDGRPVDGHDQPSRIQISKPARRQSIIEDTFRIYLGPLRKESLSRYQKAEDNAFGLSGMDFQFAPRTSSWLGWLESILRFLLEIFYKLVPNYGVAIILLTILVKAILYPFTHKSYESTSRMQGIQPKLKEIQERYKDDAQKRNEKTAELYKTEGVNPMGGCLPMLFQFPIFIALYGLLNRYFPLRGAVFIEGWITDLSAPEFIWKEFGKPLNLFVVSIPAIRILPILYLGGQLLMTRVTQQGPTGGQSAMQQKMLTLGMPIMFFFILYNMPSGLLLYWTAMNFITIGQQLVTNYFKKLKTAGAIK